MKERNENYEQKFKKYLFSFDLETHKNICKDINVLDNQNNKYKKGFYLLMEYYDSIAEEEKPKLDKELKKIGL